MNRNVLDREPVVTPAVALVQEKGVDPIREIDGIVGREHIRARVFDLAVRFAHEQANQDTLDDEPTEHVESLELLYALEIMETSIERLREQITGARALLTGEVL